MAALAAPAVRVAEARTAWVTVSTNCTEPVGALPEPCAATLTASVSLVVSAATELHVIAVGAFPTVIVNVLDVLALQVASPP